MCLPIKPYKVEREWKAFGLSCAVVLQSEAGFRCGYVRVPPGHPLHGKDYLDVYDLDVHGGLTFASLEPCSEHEDGQGWWFGFDCHHHMDAGYDPDVKLDEVSPGTRKLLKLMAEMDLKYPIHSGYEHYWTEPEVVAETERLAQQLETSKPMAG